MLFGQLRNHLADQMRNAYDQRVAHAKRPLDVGHTRIRPAFGESLQLVQLVWHQPAVAAVLRLHDMLAP